MKYFVLKNSEICKLNELQIAKLAQRSKLVRLQMKSLDEFNVLGDWMGLMSLAAEQEERT